MAKDISVRILGDARPLQRSLNGAAKNVREFEGHLGKAGRGALSASGAFSHLGRSIAFASGAFLGAAGFTQVAKQSVEAAMNLGRELNKTRAVFGTNTKAVDAWSKTTAHAFGIARSDALKSANQFGQLFKVMGVGPSKAVAMSKSLTELAAKFALFAGKSPEEASAALSQALAGRARALRTYGVVIDSVSVKAEAMRLGLIKTSVSSRTVEEAQTRLAIATAKAAEAHKKYGENTTQVASADLAVQKAHDGLAKATAGVSGEMSNAAKAQATYSLITRQSGAASETWRREQGSAEVQMRKLKAEIHDTEVTIGNALLPTVLKITTKMADWLGKTENQKKIQQELNTVIDTAGRVLGGLKEIVQKMSPVVRGLNTAVGGTKQSFELLFALGAAAKLRAIGVSLGFVGRQAAFASGEAAAGTGVAGLLMKLTKLARLGTIVVGIDILFGGHPFGRGPGGGRYSGSSGWGHLFHDISALAQGHWSDVGGGGGGGGTAPTSSGTGNPGGRGGHPAPGTGQTVNPNRFNPHGGDFMGTPGYEGSDIMTTDQGKRTGGASVLAPDDGSIIRVSTSMNAAGNVGPRQIAIYYETAAGTWWMGHLKWAAPIGRYSKGDHIATIAEGPSAHLCVNFKPGGTYNPAGGGGAGDGGKKKLKVGSSGGSPSWKGATAATIISAKASVQAMITEARQVIGGMAGPMDDIERAAIAHLEKLKAHLHPHMTPADLARTRAEIKKWGKALNDEISEQTKRAKRAFDLAAKQMLRAFDKETELGLKARAAPDETPTEKILRERSEARSAAQLQQALDEAIASGDAQAIADAQYDIETAALEKQAAAERKAADEKATADQEAYQQARDDQREALQQQLDDWNEWLTKKMKTWNQFWAWVKAHPNGGGVIPNIGETATAPGPGSRGTGGSGRNGSDAGYTWAGDDGGWVWAGGVGGVGPGVQKFAMGGTVQGRIGVPTLAVVHGGETITPPGGGGRDLHVHFDGPVYADERGIRELTSKIQKELFRFQRRNGSTGFT